MQGKTVLLTGASSGIGAALVERLAREGFVAFAGVRGEADGAAAAALHANVRPLRVDVTDRVSIDAAVRAVAESGLALRGVVCNAGIAVAGPLEYLPVDELRRQFEVNLFGALAVAQAFLPQLRAARGRLVFVGSSTGRLAVPFIAPYSASKFALRALSDGLRIELAPFGVAVSLVEPSAVKTPIWAKGRTSMPDLLALLPAQALEQYGAAIQAVVAATDREERGAMPVAAVTRAILHALTARKPRANYLLGAAAHVGSVIALLPAGLRDRLVRKTLRLP
jgi:NAD(P)-dependent dehydrogenase (short-subunit alcohol dehydrogenase family)